MGSYYIPRNYKGEGKFLYIFTGKRLLYTFVGALIAFIITFVLKLFMPKTFNTLVQVVIIAVCAVIGFGVAAIKIPEISFLGFTKKVGGESIDDIIKRYYTFKRKKNRIYVNTTSIKENK